MRGGIDPVFSAAHNFSFSEHRTPSPHEAAILSVFKGRALRLRRIVGVPVLFRASTNPDFAVRAPPASSLAPGHLRTPWILERVCLCRCSPRHRLIYNHPLTPAAGVIELPAFAAIVSLCLARPFSRLLRGRRVTGRLVPESSLLCH